MRLVIALTASLALLAGCGDDSDEPKAAASPSTPAASPTLSALDEACDAMEGQIPTGATGSWARVIQEAEHYTGSDDAEVRDVANDVIELVQPVADLEESGGSATDQSRVVADFKANWTSVADQCGWSRDLNIG